jgi:lysophospholipase L1-like esterase
MKIFRLFTVLFSLTLFTAGGGEIRFLDPGFESFRKKEKNPYWWQLLDAKSGTARSDAKVKYSGKYSLKVTVRDEFLYVRYLGGPFKTRPAVRYSFSIRAKGKGILNLVVMQNTEKVGYVGEYWSKKTTPLCSADFQLTGEWKQYTFVFAGNHPGLFYMNPMIAVSGDKAYAYLDDAKISRLNPEADSLLDPIPSCTVVKRGRKSFFFPGGEKLPEGAMALFSGRMAQYNGKYKKIPSAGKWSVHVPEEPGCYPFALVHEKNGIGKRCYVHVLEESRYDKLLKKSSSIPANPGKVLILGDSLSDYLRGYNYVDIVQHFCRLRFGAQTRFYNYGVGGDQAPRVLDRLRGVKGTYALHRYKGIHQTDPDLIFISLGHNDSLSLNRDLKEKSPTQVSPEKFAATLKEIIVLLRQRHPKAKIVLFTPYALCYKKTLKHFFGNRKLLYGEPAILKKFAGIVKAVGAETQCGVLDVYTPTSRIRDTSSYFMYDGIHLNLQGNFLAAELILQYLAEGGKS